MEPFNKKINEDEAIKCLKEYDSRYKNLVKSERPDFISEEDSIGVELTLVEFDNFIDSFKYKNKTLIEYARMNKKIIPNKKKEFKIIDEIIYNNYSADNIDDINIFIDSYYYKKGNDLLKIESIEQYKKLDPNTNLYLKSLFPDERYINGQRIICHLPCTFWSGQIVDKYLRAVNVKNNKFENYKKFDENSLLLINYTTGLEENIEFEEKIK
ncbi:hypothetical protein ABGF48_03615 [Helcococcus bovis]